jgi:hypothetical protein
MPKAKWSTVPREITASTDADGTFTASVPLYDDGVKAATLRFTITAERALTVLCENEPGLPGLSGFQAWVKEA